MAATLIAAAVAALAQAPSPADEFCYDRAVVGSIRHADGFVDLNDFYRGGGPGAVMLGGRWDVEIRVDRVLAGARTPTTIKARAVLTHMIRPQTRRMFLLRRGPLEAGMDNEMEEWSGGFVPHASTEHPWSVVLIRAPAPRLDPGDPSLPPRCSPPG